MLNHRTVHPDAKGCIALGSLAKGISSFRVFDDKDALKRVKKGLADSAAGKVSLRGDFSQYIEE